LWRESSRQKDVSFYREDPKPPMFRSARYPGTAPWYLSTSSHEAAARSRTCLSRSEGRRGSLGVGDVSQNKRVRKRETPVRNPSRSRIVTSHKSRDKSRENTRYARACVCVLLIILNHLKYSTRASLICWSLFPQNIKVALNLPCIPSTPH
jgi:hypothetical protein